MITFTCPACATDYDDGLAACPVGREACSVFIRLPADDQPHSVQMTVNYDLSAVGGKGLVQEKDEGVVQRDDLGVWTFASPVEKVSGSAAGWKALTLKQLSEPKDAR